MGNSFRKSVQGQAYAWNPVGGVTGGGWGGKGFVSPPNTSPCPFVSPEMLWCVLCAWWNTLQMPSSFAYDSLSVCVRLFYFFSILFLTSSNDQLHTEALKFICNQVFYYKKWDISGRTNFDLIMLIHFVVFTNVCGTNDFWISPTW